MNASKSTTPINIQAKPIVKIATPCHEKWSDMSPTEKGKFCSSCAKEVVDFTSNTNEEIASHLKKAEGSVCGRLYSNQVVTGTSVSGLKYFFQKSKTYLATLLAVLSVSAIFGEKADAQTRNLMKGRMKINPIPEQSTANTRETTIRGTVTLANTKTPAPMAAIQVSSAGEMIEQTVTNTNGEYKVQLPPGTVQNQEVSLTTSLLGYVDKTIEALKVLKDEVTLNFSIEEEFMMMGDIAYIPEVKMGQVAYIPEPETQNKLGNEHGQDMTGEIKTIETIPEKTVQQEAISNNVIVMLGKMIMVDPYPDNILEESIDKNPVEPIPVDTPPINYIEELTVEGQMVLIDPEPPVEENPIEVHEQPELSINDDNVIRPNIEVEITDGPEPITIEESSYNPIAPLENKEPIQLLSPVPLVQVPISVVKINKIRSIMSKDEIQNFYVTKTSCIGPKAIHEEVEVDVKEYPQLVEPIADVEASLDNSIDEEPIEAPVEFDSETDEGTRESLDPTLDSKMIISVYPNPTTEYFNIDLGSDESFLMQLYDASGRQVRMSKIDKSSSRVDTSTMEPGSYLVRISNAMGDQVETKKIVII
ncbi:MAG: T9SS type A sorting domain-containing protein [Flavobacteriales bacterium]|nr:T9SS type A sorting domain-containing protein [Flavobacteriales bacterium]